MAASSHIKDPNREQRDFTGRVIALFLLALLAIFVLIARMIHLQVADYEKYRTRSDQNRIQVQPIGPPRGLIFDRNGVLLADNQPVFYARRSSPNRSPISTRCWPNCTSWSSSTNATSKRSTNASSAGAGRSNRCR